MNFMKFAALVPVGMLAACGGNKDTADTAPQGCGVTIYESVPATDAPDHYYRAPVEFHLTGADETAVASVTDSAGAAVSGTSTQSDNALTVYFTPDAPLTSSSSFTANLAYCSGDASVPFSTSSLGAGLDKGTDLLGNTYALNLNESRFVKPEGIGVLLQQYVTQEILVSITAVDTSISMIGGIAVEGSEPPSQDFCTETFDFPEADFSGSPFFLLGPADTPLTIAGFTITIGDMLVSGTFASDASYFGGGVLSGQIDGDEVAEAFDEIEDAEALCALASSVGATCEDCGDGRVSCLSIEVDQIHAAQVVDTTLEAVAVPDCHASCTENSKDCDLGGGDTGTPL
jgi:hypothetical protein